MLEEVEKKQGIASNPNNSVWTSASAGSGKTTVLTKRLLRMFLSGVQPSKILCITFTNTGAAEMRNRINSKLAEWTMLDDERLEKEIIDLEEGRATNIEEKVKIARSLFAKILDYSNDFKILTIHSFCQQIIKRFPLEANIIPNFKIADEITSMEILLQAKEELLKVEDEDIRNAIKYVFTYKNEDDFLEILKQMIGQKDNLLYMKSRFFTVSGVLDEIRKIFGIAKYQTVESLENDYLNSFDLSILDNNLLEDIKVIGAKSDVDFANAVEYLKNNGFKDNFEKYLSIFLTKEGTARSRVITKKVGEKYPDLLNFVDGEVQRAFNFNETRNNIINFEFTSAFLKITYCLFDIYSKIKKENGYLDYSDLIFETSRLLNDTKYRNLNGENPYSSWINYKLDEGIDHLLIDEAQDTSPIQWDIVKSITAEFFVGYGQKGDTNRTIFVVGDEKQSIFSFQGAEPANFDTMLKYYQRVVEDCGKKFENIYLETSFRSLKSVLQVADEVFSEPSRRCAISKLQNAIKHNVIRKDGIGKVEIWPLVSAADAEDDDEDVNDKRITEAKDWDVNYREKIKITNKQKLAETIANEIESWFKNGKTIYSRRDKCIRNIRYSDIMILVRNRDEDFINHLIRQFNRRNIRSMGNDKFNLVDNIISQDIISLCKFILFNEDDLSLANILKSPFLSLMEEDLYFLCDYRNTNNCSLWKAMQENEKYVKEKEFLSDLIEKNKEFSIYQLFFYIFETIGMRKKFKERFIYIADDVINEFLASANNYEKNHNNSTLLNFIYFIENTNLEIKRDIDQSTNEIKIMTVHSSKGLESPIVILPDTNHTKKTIQKINKVLEYKQIGNDYTIPLLQKEKTTFIENIKEEMKFETEEEYLRLLYVAITRAENELYVCDYKKSGEPKENSWYEILRKAVENIGAKHKKSQNIDGDVIYIGDDDVFDTNINGCKSENKKTVGDGDVDSIIETIRINGKSEKETKIINPSTYYSENNFKTPIDNTKNIENGKVVHKLLEILPAADKCDWENILNIYLNENEDSEKIKVIVLKILNNDEFSFLFNPNSKAEVPIFGKLDDDIISGQIDRLSIVGDIVYLIDYKNTNSLPAVVPQKYVKQLELYKKLLEKIYINKEIKTYILWTSFGKIEEVNIK